EVLGAARLGHVGGQRLAGGALAQHAVAAGTALEEDLAGLRELVLAHVRCALGADLVDRVAAEHGRRALVGGLGLAGAGVQFALGRVGGYRQRRAPGGDFGLGDAAAGVAPLVHDIGRDGGDVGVADVALRRHQAVVGDAVDHDLAVQAGEHGGGDVGGGLALQP